MLNSYFTYNCLTYTFLPICLILQVSCCSVAQSCPTLCNPMDCSMPGFPIHHHLLQLAQTHVQWVSDGIPPISYSCVPFSSCLQSFPASGSFLMSQLFTSGGQSIGASGLAPVLPVDTPDWLPLGLTGLISLLSKGLLRVFPNCSSKASVLWWCSSFFMVQLSHCTWLLEKP